MQNIESIPYYQPLVLAGNEKIENNDEMELESNDESGLENIDEMDLELPPTRQERMNRLRQNVLSVRHSNIRQVIQNIEQRTKLTSMDLAEAKQKKLELNEVKSIIDDSEKNESEVIPEEQFFENGDSIILELNQTEDDSNSLKNEEIVDADLLTEMRSMQLDFINDNEKLNVFENANSHFTARTQDNQARTQYNQARIQYNLEDIEAHTRFLERELIQINLDIDRLNEDRLQELAEYIKSKTIKPVKETLKAIVEITSEAWAKTSNSIKQSASYLYDSLEGIVDGGVEHGNRFLWKVISNNPISYIAGAIFAYHGMKLLLDNAVICLAVAGSLGLCYVIKNQQYFTDLIQSRR